METPLDGLYGDGRLLPGCVPYDRGSDEDSRFA